MITRGQLAMIHVAKKEIGMTEAEYRDFLQGFGVSSSKELNNNAFGAVLDRFKAMGFKPKGKNQTKARAVAADKKPLMGKLYAMLKDLGKDWHYANAIAKKRFNVERVQWLGKKDLYKVVQMIAIQQKREIRKRAVRV